MLIPIIVIGLLSLSNAFVIDLYDFESMNHYINNSFHILANNTAISLNDPRINKIINANKKISFSISKVKDFTVNFKPYSDIRADIYSAEYIFGNIFTVDVEANYVWFYGYLPISGSCIFRFAPSKTIVRSIFKENITTGCNINTEVSVLNITNTIAINLGVRTLIESSTSNVIDFFKHYINVSFSNHTDRYFEMVLGNHSQFSSLPFKNAHKIRIETTKKYHIVVCIVDVIQLFTKYEQSFTNTTGTSNTAVTSSPHNFTRLVRYNGSLLDYLVKQETIGIKDIRLAKLEISNQTMFQLDASSLSRIYPDLMYVPNVEGYIDFTINSDSLKLTPNLTTKLFAFKDLYVDLKVGYTDGKDIPLAKIGFTITGLLLPILHYPDGPLGKIFLRLRAIEATTENLKIEGLWKNPYAVLNKASTRSFIQSMITHYFLASYRDEALGNGIHIATGIPNQRVEYDKDTKYDHNLDDFYLVNNN